MPRAKKPSSSDVSSSPKNCRKDKAATEITAPAETKGVDAFGKIAAKFKCDECQHIRENNPKGWISASCHVCGFGVWFETLERRSAYLRTSDRWCNVCHAVGHLQTCATLASDELEEMA